MTATRTPVADPIKEALRFEINHQVRALVGVAMDMERLSDRPEADPEVIAKLCKQANRALQRIDDYLWKNDEEG